MEVYCLVTHNYLKRVYMTSLRVFLTMSSQDMNLDLQKATMNNNALVLESNFVKFDCVLTIKRLLGLSLLTFQTFDCVNHELLISKLNDCGLDYLCVKFFQRYLNHQKEKKSLI